MCFEIKQMKQFQIAVNFPLIFPDRLTETINILENVQRDSDGHVRGVGLNLLAVSDRCCQHLFAVASQILGQNITGGNNWVARHLNQTKSRKGHVLCHYGQVLVNIKMEFLSYKLRGMLLCVLFWSAMGISNNRQRCFRIFVLI